MNAQSQIAALTAEYTASKGIGLTVDKLCLRADLVTQCSMVEDDDVTVFFTEEQAVFDAGDDGYDYGQGPLTLIGAYIENPATGKGFCIGREDAITRWGQSTIAECEEFFDARNT